MGEHLSTDDQPSVVTARGAAMRQLSFADQNILDAMDAIARGDVDQLRRAIFGSVLNLRAFIETLPDAIHQIEKELG